MDEVALQDAEGDAGNNSFGLEYSIVVCPQNNEISGHIDADYASIQDNVALAGLEQFLEDGRVASS